MNKTADTNVLLGTCKGISLCSKEDENPRITKIGGQPIFFDYNPSSSRFKIREPLVCSICNSAEFMRLVMQVYSPTDDLDRTLYIFSCTSELQCALQSKGWLVFRNQVLFQENTACKDPSSKVSNIKDSTKSINNTSQVTKNGENTYSDKLKTVPTNQKQNNLLQSSSSSSSSNSSVWSFLKDPKANDTIDTNDDDEFSDLEALVNNFTDSVTQSKNRKSKSNQISNKTKQTQFSQETLNVELQDHMSATTTKLLEQSSNIYCKLCKSYWPAWKITETYDEEEWIPNITHTSFSSNNSGTNKLSVASAVQVDDLMSSALRNEGILSDERIQAMYDTYLKIEEDLCLVSRLPKQFNGEFNKNNITSNDDDNDNDDSGEEDNTKLSKTNKNNSKPTGLNGTSNANNGFDHEADNNAAYLTERLFQHKCHMEPHQVLRYIYDGSPLWCTYPHPTESQHIPVCEVCGSDRVFEMQLMPALLSLPLPVLPPSVPVVSKLGSADFTQQQTTSQSISIVSGLNKVSNTLPTNLMNKKSGNDSSYNNSKIGIDFGIVAIYSCPNSCFYKTEKNHIDQISNCLYKEYAVVQPPADIVHQKNNN